MLFNLLFTLITSTQVDASGLVCLKDKSSCPSSYKEISITDLTSLKINGETTILVKDAPIEAVELIPNQEGSKLSINIVGENLATVLKLKASSQFEKFTAKSITANLVGPINIGGSLSTNNAEIFINDLTIEDFQITENICINMVKFNSINPKISCIHSKEDDLLLTIGKNLAILSKDFNNRLTIRSIGKDLSFLVEQSAGTLQINRIGRVTTLDMFEFNINGNGGIIKFSDQKWEITKEVNVKWVNFVPLQNYIVIHHKTSTNILISGIDIPVSILNEATTPLQIICEKNYVGIQGEIKTNHVDDEIKVDSKLSGDVEFAVGMISGNQKLKASENIYIGLTLESKDKVASGVKTLLREYYQDDVQNEKIENFELAANAIIYIYALRDTDDNKEDFANYKIGLIEITQRFTFSKNGKPSLIIDYDDIFNAFGTLSLFVEADLEIFTSVNEFSANDFDVQFLYIESAKYETFQPLNKKCVNENGKYKLIVKPDTSIAKGTLTQTIAFFNEDVGMDGIIMASNSDLDTVIKSLNPNSKMIQILLLMDMEDSVSINLDDLPTTDAVFVIGNGGYPTPPKVNIKYGPKSENKISQIIISGITLDLIPSEGYSDVNFKYCKFFNCEIKESTKNRVLNFKQIVRMDYNTFNTFKKSKFNELIIENPEEVNEVEYTNTGYNIKIPSADVKTIKKENINKIIFSFNCINPKITASSDVEYISSVIIELASDSDNPQKTLDFDGTNWETIEIKNYLAIYSGSDTVINNLPHKAVLEINGMDINNDGIENIVISIRTTANEINIGNNIPFLGHINIEIEEGKTINFKDISVNSYDSIKQTNLMINSFTDYLSSYYPEIKATHNNQLVQINADKVESNENLESTIGSIKINKEIKVDSSSKLSISELELPNSDIGPDISLHFKFESDKVPQLNIGKVIGIPKKISMIYDGTKEETMSIDYDYWINDTNAIISSNFDRITCNKWKDLIEVNSLIQLESQLPIEFACVPNFAKESTFDILFYLTDNVAVKEEESGGSNENKSSESDENNSSESDENNSSESNENNSSESDENNSSESSSELDTGSIVGIVIGCIAFVAIVSFLVYWFAFRGKSNDEEEKEEPSV